MKTIKAELSLHGKTDCITLSELRKQPGEVFQQVELGKRFIVMKNGKSIAAITRLDTSCDAVINPDGTWRFA